MLPAAGQAFDVFDLGLPIRCAVAVEDFVKPFLRLGGVLPAPRIPRVVRLRLAGDEAPVVSGDVLLFEIAEHRVEAAAVGAGHVFGAEDRAAVALELLHARLDVLEPAVVVETDDVRLLDHHFLVRLES